MLTPAEIARTYVSVGKNKAALPAARLLLLAFLAGAFIALAGAGATFGNVYVNRAMGAAIFPAGLAMVILAGSELFTGNCLLVIPLLEREITLGQAVRNLALVYLGNLLGGVFVSACGVYGGTFDAIAETVVATAAAKCTLPFAAGFLRGILCNVLVCLGVWMALAAKDVAGKVVGLFFPIFVFVICGYEHCIANMFYIPAGLMAAARCGMAAEGLSLVGFLHNLLPVTLGNMVGGAGLGAIYWAIYLKKR